MTTTIPVLPAAPNPATDTPTEFSNKAAAMVLAQVAWVPQLNTFGTEVTALGTAATASAAAAAASAVSTAADAATATAGAATATTKAADASASAAAAAASAAMAGSIVAFSDANPIVKGSGDVTKLLRFEVDGLPTATTTVLTVLKGGTVAMLDDAPGGGGAVVSGDVTLTATSGGAQMLTTTLPGQWVQLPDATAMPKGAAVFTIKENGLSDRWIKDATGSYIGVITSGTSVVIGLADKTTVAGQWLIEGGNVAGLEALTEVAISTGGGITLIETAILDATKTLLIAGGTLGIYGIAYDASTHLFGAPVLLRMASPGDTDHMRVIKLTATTALLISTAGTSLQALVITVTGTVVTMGSPVTKTLTAAYVRSSAIVAAGGSYVFCYYMTSVSAIEAIAVTVSGTVPTIGTAAAPSTSLGIGGANDNIQLYAVSATAVMYAQVFDNGSTRVAGVRVLSLSGTTITMGAFSTITLDGGVGILIRALASGNFAAAYVNGQIFGTIISISGTAISVSTPVSLYTTYNCIASSVAVQTIGSQVVVSFNVVTGSNTIVNVLTDNAGTAVAGTPFTVWAADTDATPRPLGASGGEAWIAPYKSSIDAVLVKVSISGNNPVVSTMRRSLICSNTFDNSAPSYANLTKPEIGLATLRTTARALGISAYGVDGYAGYNVLAKAAGTSKIISPVLFTSGATLAKGATDAEAWSVLQTNASAGKLEIRKGRLI